MSKNWPATTHALPSPRSSSASARATVGDAGATLRDYAEGINASPERLAEIEDRLALLDRLKRKYGQTVAEVIAFGEDVARKLSEVEDRDEILKDPARGSHRSSRKPTSEPPPPLTAERKTAAAKLAKLAEAQINSLAMKVRFQIDVAPSEQEASLDCSRLGRGRIPHRHQPRGAAQAATRNRLRRRNVAA